MINKRFKEIYFGNLVYNYGSVFYPKIHIIITHSIVFTLQSKGFRLYRLRLFFLKRQR